MLYNEPNNKNGLGQVTQNKSRSTRPDKKNQTREQILATALSLFNQHGFETVSTRQIAQQAGISQGNLTYHFPAREQIVEALYYQLWQAFEELLQTRPDAPPGLEQQVLGTYLICQTQYRYRFIMLDFVGVMRRHPAIRAHFVAMVPHRQRQFEIIFSHYTAQGWMQPEPAPGVYQRLVLQAYILGDFWLAEGAILFKGTEQEMLLHYSELLCGLFYAYLTPLGRQIFERALAELPGQVAGLNHL